MHFVTLEDISDLPPPMGDFRSLYTLGQGWTASTRHSQGWALNSARQFSLALHGFKGDLSFISS